MPKPSFETILSPNHGGPRKKSISAIVIHYTASMSIEGTISWFKDTKAKVSAHYVIGRDGRVVQMVPDNLIAWHAGRSAMRPPNGEPNVNAFSLGIELVGTMDSGFTDKQMASLYSLLEVLVATYKVKPERVVGHLHISPGRKQDPDGLGQQFNWAKTREIVARAYQSVAGAHT